MGEEWASPLPHLTDIEKRVLELMVEGTDGRTIASELQISRNEVRTHIQSVLRKLNVHSRLEAAAFAVRSRLLEIRGTPRPIRVSIVDDHELFAEAIRAALLDAGIDVAAVLVSGRDAVAYLEQDHSDVVLLDIGLPDRSGLALGREILESWPEAKLIALTALDDPRAINEAMTLGFRGYLLKETSVSRCVGSIEAVAAGERVFPDLTVSEDLRHSSGTSIVSEGSVFERFTDPAKRVVALAQEEARMLNHNYIGTEHILLGLVHEGDGAAAKALDALNISLEAVRRQVEAVIGRGQAAPTGASPFTPRAKKVLELSFREALQLGHNYIGTEHILLGLIREGEGVAAEVLQRLGADLKRIRETVIQQLSESVAGSPEEMLATLPPEFHRGKPKSPFTKREWIVLSLLIEGGLTTSEIAELLGVSEEKVGEIVQAVIEKLKDLT